MFRFIFNLDLFFIRVTMQWKSNSLNNLKIKHHGKKEINTKEKFAQG